MERERNGGWIKQDEKKREDDVGLSPVMSSTPPTRSSPSPSSFFVEISNP